eukprot:CAMPEP_0197035990 /NCGR_PEP_ID=MMETSP1384-20130603/13625_1 /TAXON_ID=29189 /ORGANISM="Ammonia sp." /LENGTH=229 /DNA_ID=CAMNT_0042466111 /DNA_START=31 /DNA_END=717 /DNA_ORIENTATION=+
MAAQPDIMNEAASIPLNEKLISTTLTLHDGTTIPLVGLSTFDTNNNASAQESEQSKKKETEFRDAILFAVRNGYRHIDTAQTYGTESAVGEAVKMLIAQNVIKREDVFLTTKVAQNKRKPDEIRECIEQSLKELQVEYIDLMLIDSPHSNSLSGAKGNDVIDLYKILHEYKAKGKIKSVGVCNFGVKHLEILEKSCPDLAVPSCNQIECHPFRQETEVIQYCQKKGIAI